jgi:hypothetical protein
MRRSRAAKTDYLLGIDSFEPFEMDGSSKKIEGAACSTDSSDTWANRDAMISAVNDFCAGMEGSVLSSQVCVRVLTSALPRSAKSKRRQRQPDERYLQLGLGRLHERLHNLGR